MRVAYVVSRYPLVSHTFIVREVQELRRQGVAVDTFTVRRTDEHELPEGEHRRELATTFALRPIAPLRLAAAHARALVRAPGAYVAALREAWQQAPPGLRGRLWGLFYFAQAIVLAAECERRGITHVHAHHANVASDVAMLAALYGRCSGSSPRTWSFTMHGPTEFFDVNFFRPGAKAERAEFVVCISEYCRSQLMSLSSPDCWARMHVVHCGVETELIAPADRPPPDREGAFRVLNVGRLAPVKGQAVLLDAIAALARDGRDVELLVVGDGPERAALERAAGGLELNGRVRLLGARSAEETLALYQQADAFCLTSFAEGLPVVLMEALAAGLPSVATRIMGVPELIEDGRTGLLVTPGRADEVAAALARLADDADLRSRLAAAGRKKVEAEFELEGSVARLRELFAGYA